VCEDFGLWCLAPVVNFFGTMAPKQRMRIANEKASKNVTMRGNVPKSSVSMPIVCYSFEQLSVYFRKCGFS
jgi:hypothetical protein